MALATGEDDQRPHEIVPTAEEGEHGQRHQDRPAQRQYQRPENAELAGAVDARRIEQAVGDARGMLADQKDAEDAGQPRYDHAGQGIDQPQRFQQQEQRQHRRLSRYHHRRQQRLKQPIATRKAQLGKGVAGQGIEHE